MGLASFHNWVKTVVRQACESALMTEEFVPDPVEDGTYVTSEQ